MLCQTEHGLRAMRRTAQANSVYGIETQMVSPERIKDIVPIINIKGRDIPF